MGTVVQTVEETTRLMENTDPKYVFLCFDTGHFTFAGEDPVAMLEKFADRVGHVHLKNMRMPIVEKVKAEDWSFLKAVREGAFTWTGAIRMAAYSLTMYLHCLTRLATKAGSWLRLSRTLQRQIRSSMQRWLALTSRSTLVFNRVSTTFKRVGFVPTLFFVHKKALCLRY